VMSMRLSAPRQHSGLPCKLPVRGIFRLQSSWLIRKGRDVRGGWVGAC
jgi:hypothetical protein